MCMGLCTTVEISCDLSFLLTGIQFQPFAKQDLLLSEKDLRLDRLHGQDLHLTEHQGSKGKTKL